MTQIIETQEATKEFEEFTLGPISLQVGAGECLCILGMNGAGKSTLFSLITGTQDCTSGTVRINGQRFLPDHYQVKRQIGYLPQNFDLPLWLTPRNILNYAARLYGFDTPTEVVNETLHTWDCDSYADLPLAHCSHGMKKRAALGLATIHQPALLVLDEPFSGLDIYHIHALEQLLQMRSKTGKATILSTHISLYAARLANTSHIMQDGALSPLKGWEQADVLERINLVEGIFAQHS